MRFALLILIVLSESVYPQVTDNTFVDPESGLSISKPMDWDFKKFVAQGVQLKNGRFEVERKGYLVGFGKDLRNDSLGNPSVAISLVKHVRRDANLLQAFANDFKVYARQNKKFQVVLPPSSASISGSQNAAQAAFLNNVVEGGKELRLYHVQWMVRASRKIYMIHMSCAEALAPQYELAFRNIAASLVVNSRSKSPFKDI